jgi:hypothetical protein
MSKLTFSLKLAEDNSTISKNIINALLPDIRRYFTNISNKLTRIIPDIVIKAIIAQPEYQALLNGQLQYELGIPDPAARLSEILETIKSGQSINIQAPQLTGNRISAKLTFGMVKKDFSDLLSLGAATINTEKGVQLNWLEWLLVQGDTVIISNYDFILGPSPYSRTGMGIMRERSGGSWRVPPEYAGTVNNNWITRAIDSAAQSIDQTITNIINN